MLLVFDTQELARWAEKRETVHKVVVQAVRYYYIWRKGLEPLLKQRQNDSAEQKLDNRVDQVKKFTLSL